jgi:hypothetical protein
MSLVDAKDASVIITGAEQLPQLVQEGASLPKQVVLAGEEEAVVLKSSLIPRMGRARWQPESVGSEDGLMNRLRSLI